MSKVVIGMSGGVDSSVAAILLKKQGYEVIGATFKFLEDETNTSDAKEICNKLNIEHVVFDYVDKFKNIVIDNFINSYKNGLTPNPCVICNKYFKFKAFYEEAKKLGADFIATGHYAKIVDGKLVKSDNVKDQTYFLWNIDKEILNHVIFPLGDFKTKAEIRKIALDNNLTVATKKDSQDVCFINGNYTDYLTKNYTPSSGNIILSDGTILGKHKGIIFYTIGQRKGLVSYKEPLYVIGFKGNDVIVGTNDLLYLDTLECDNVNLLVDELPNEVYAKIRSRSNASLASVKIIKNKAIVKFKEKQRAITKGQSVVFYDDQTCLGGGIIK